jgi:poly(3-hydroxybutyrate) depolymerase
MLDEIEANYCIDQTKVFAGGYSSGAWFAATLSCSHGDRINGIGMAAGGQQDELPVCKGQSAMILWAGNEGATGNPIDTPPNVAWEGSGAVRDRLITANGCMMTKTKWDPMWASCDVYDGCGKNPVVFCPHGGGHDNGNGSQINSLGFWKLFKSTW